MKKIKGNLKFRGAAVSIPKGVRQSSKKFKLLLYQIFCRRLISGRGIVNGRVSYLTICWDSALNPKICKFTLPLSYCRVAIFGRAHIEIWLSLFYLPGCNLSIDILYHLFLSMSYIFTSGLHFIYLLSLCIFIYVFLSMYFYLCLYILSM